MVRIGREVPDFKADHIFGKASRDCHIVNYTVAIVIQGSKFTEDVPNCITIYSFRSVMFVDANKSRKSLPLLLRVLSLLILRESDGSL